MMFSVNTEYSIDLDLLVESHETEYDNFRTLRDSEDATEFLVYMLDSHSPESLGAEADYTYIDIIG